MVVSIHLTDAEKKTADDYAKRHGISTAEAFRRALFEKIEDEFDRAVADEALAAYMADGKTSRPIEELLREMDL